MQKWNLHEWLTKGELHFEGKQLSKLFSLHLKWVFLKGKNLVLRGANSVDLISEGVLCVEKQTRSLKSSLLCK